MEKETRYGYCKCGCGGKTLIAQRNSPKYKKIKGKPNDFIRGHNSRLRIGKKNINWKGGMYISGSGYLYVKNPNNHRAMKNGYVLKHILIAEKALGKAFPEKAIIHHVDEDRLNNKPSNLVICENQAYHMLLHQRLRALISCGNANWMMCRYWKKYDDIKNLKTYKNKFYFHRDCYNKYQNKSYYRRKKTIEERSQKND